MHNSDSWFILQLIVILTIHLLSIGIGISINIIAGFVWWRYFAFIGVSTYNKKTNHTNTQHINK